MSQNNRIAYFPISFFAMVMGLSGLTIAWSKAQQVYAIKSDPGSVLAYVTVAVFVVLLFFYVIKLIKHVDEVKKEIKHPIKLNFFPTISISLILLSIIFLHRNESLSNYLWLAGTSIHFLFLLYVVNSWIHHEHYEIHHLNPAWFIPAVGNVLVPIAGIPLGYIDLSWFFFSVGIIFWLILLTIIFYRVLFHNPLPDRLMPTLFILIAPPAVGFLSYIKLTGVIDSFGRTLYFIGLFFTLLLLTQFNRFIKLKFFLSWWAYSFPLAAITIATFLMYEMSAKIFYSYLGIALLCILTVVVTGLLIMTSKAIFNQGICVKEEP